MRLERADKLRRQALQSFRDLASQTVFYGFSHDDFLNRRKPVLKLIETCPAHVKSNLSGYMQRFSEEWHEKELAYCHKSPDGQLYTAHKGAIESGLALDVDLIYKAARGHEIPSWQSNFYWLQASKREAQFGRPPKIY